MRSLFSVLILTTLCIALVLITGCTQTSPASVPTTTTQPATVPVTTIPSPAATPISTSTPVVVTTTSAPVPTTTSATDPIVHRWINQTVLSPLETGREVRCFPDGSVQFNGGTIDEISGNFVIKNVIVTFTGTWVNIGGNEYTMKMVNPLSSSTTPIIYDVYYYPPSTNPKFPGITYPEHILVKSANGDVEYDRTKLDSES